MTKSVINKKSTDSSKIGNKQTDWSSLPNTFKKGNPGGPGRPAGSRNKITLELEQIGEDNAILAMDRMIDLSLNGDPSGCFQACKYILDRVMPPRKGAKMPFGISTRVKTVDELNALSEKIIAMMIDGDLSAEEAVEVGKAIEQRLKVIIETDDTEIRSKYAALREIVDSIQNDRR